MNREQAMKLFESKFWQQMNKREIAAFQLFEVLLCMPFGVFHEALEDTLGRPVQTLEFALNLDELKKEFLGERAAPSTEEILALIPMDKRVIVVSHV